MVRKLAALLAAGLLGTVAGCHCVHHAGKCDCDMDGPCCPPWGSAAVISPAAPIITPIPVVTPPVVTPPAGKTPEVVPPPTPKSDTPPKKSDTPPEEPKKISGE